MGMQELLLGTVLASSIKLRSLEDILPLPKITFPLLGREIGQLDTGLTVLCNNTVDLVLQMQFRYARSS